MVELWKTSKVAANSKTRDSHRHTHLLYQIT